MKEFNDFWGIHSLEHLSQYQRKDMLGLGIGTYAHQYYSDETQERLSNVQRRQTNGEQYLDQKGHVYSIIPHRVLVRPLDGASAVYPARVSCLDIGNGVQGPSVPVVFQLHIDEGASCQRQISHYTVHAGTLCLLAYPRCRVDDQ